MTQRIRLIQKAGKEIFVLDLSGTKPAEAMRLIADAQPLVAAAPPKSVLFLTDVRGATYDKPSGSAIKEFASRNTPHIRASAVVGAEGLRAVLLTGIRMLTGREIRTFDEPDHAIDWLLTR